MLGGYVMFALGGALRMDWIGKIAFNLIAAVWLARGPRPKASEAL